MAIVTPGTGATCKSATAEGQLHEILSFLAHHQGHSSTNPENVINVTATHSQQGRTYSGTYRFNAVQTITMDGHLEIEATPYLVGTNFLVGTGGTFKGNSPEKYALEILMYMQIKENNESTNPQNRNFITGSYNSDTGRYEGSFSLPVSFALDASNGNVAYSASEYLL